MANKTMQFATIAILMGLCGCSNESPMTQERLDTIKEEFATCMELAGTSHSNTVRACDSIAWSREYWQNHVKQEQK